MKGKNMTINFDEHVEQHIDSLSEALDAITPAYIKMFKKNNVDPLTEEDLELLCDKLMDARVSIQLLKNANRLRVADSAEKTKRRFNLFKK